jgi:probable phosphoglycerate mutase
MKGQMTTSFPSPAELILVRHGQTAGNGVFLDLLISGWADLPLTEVGIRQVVLLRQRFDSELAIDALYCSPLHRARATAALLFPHAGRRVRLHDDLREINCGEVDGLPVSYVKTKYAKDWERSLQQDDEHFRWPGGESYRELRTRALGALDQIAARHPGERVLVVTHASVISQTIGALYGLSPGSWESFRPHNTSLTHLRWSEHTREIVLFDDYRHLCGAPELLPETTTTASSHQRAG